MAVKRTALQVTILLSVLLTGATGVRADIRLPSVISHNMVLQRDMPVRLWGWANPGEPVSISFQDQTVSTQTGQDGRWAVTLEALQAGGPFNMTLKGKTERVLKNILVGDVWICSGQSNMAWPLKACDDGEQEVEAADFPRIRLFEVKNNSACQPLDDLTGNWSRCSPQTAADFSGVGYFFGRDLHRHLDVPIGLIDSSVGGTAAEFWTPPETFRRTEPLRTVLEDWTRRMITYVDEMQPVQDTLRTWRRNAEQQLAEGSDASPPPLASREVDPRTQAPSRLYNAMIHPLVPFGIRGAIWYQGEANTAKARAYRDLFPAMIRGWREAWGQGDFPFLFVQLANFQQPNSDPVFSSGWAELREAQMVTLAEPETGMAVAIDIGDAADIHPKNKQEVGRRLAQAAKAVAYDEDLTASGPIFKEFTVAGHRAIIAFDHVGGGLVAQDGALKRFEIAGKDGMFRWAQARIVGERVEVWHDDIQEPMAVRYAWSNNPEGCNLYNKAGLPASPFRTMEDINLPLPRETHHAPCVATKTPPRLDGKLDDTAWQAMKPLSAFRVLEQFRYSDYATDVRLCYDSDNLYLAIRCHEPELETVVAAVTDRDGPVYMDDSVEVFLDTDLDAETYFQYVVNPNGVWYDGLGRNGAWNGPCNVVSGREPNAWVIEMAVPWSTLEVDPPKAGKSIGFQVARTRAQSPVEISQWAPTRSPTNHRPSHFGLLVIE
jgi:sialate O-acetylesterase